jgi:hypothetical protein
MTSLARMSHYMLMSVCCCTALPAFAGFVSHQSLDRFNTDGNFVLFGVGDVAPAADTCTYYHDQFKFDASTAQGKNMLALLLLVKETGQPLDIWYEPSSAPGTTEANGCGEFTLSIVDNVGVSQ